MPSVDFHAQCNSYVRISIKDLNGKYGVYLDHQHPKQLRYPNVSVGVCELVAGHAGRCEMFVEGEGGSSQPYRGHWLSWERRSEHDELQDTYRWDTYGASCLAQSPHGWYCNRYDGHAGGHAFNIED